jgi:glycosyltransferase involved in cell wall biosynthesis
VRIALVAPLVSTIGGAQLGGSQSVISDLALGLSLRGHEVDVYAAAGSQIQGARLVDTGVDSRSLAAARLRPGQPAAEPPEALVEAFRSVHAAIADQDYDVIHNHAFDAPAITLAAEAATPVVHTLHLPPDRAVAAAVRAARSGPHAPRVAAVSVSQAEAWSRLERVDVILGNGVPTSRMAWSALPGAGAVYAGRLSQEKGAAEAIAIARAAGLGIEIFGEAYDPEYTIKRIEPYRHAPGVVLRGPLERAQLWDRIRGASVVLCPSLWDEPFGMVAAEAQALGTPVLAFASGNLPRVVVDGLTGFVVRPGDVDAAAGALNRVKTIRRQACRRHAERHLDLEATLDAHEACYRKAIVDAGVATGAGL